MSPELDAKLCEKYPKIFANRNADMKETAMCWGFDHSDGWYTIINHLCACIQHHIDWSQTRYEQDLKYNAMVADMQAGNFASFDEHTKTITNLDYKEKCREDILKRGAREAKAPCPQVVADQVKEKFGTLRFYYSGGDDFIRGLVSMAEAMSAVTCEVCGKPGKREGQSWVRTVCEEHKSKNDL